MSNAALNYVWFEVDASIPAPTKFVLVAIADHHNDERGSSMITNERIQTMTGLSKRQVQRHTKKLKEVNLVEVLSGGNGAGDPCYYKIVGFSPNKGDVHDTLQNEIRVSSKAIRVSSKANKGVMDDTQSLISLNDPIVPTPPQNAKALNDYVFQMLGTFIPENTRAYETSLSAATEILEIAGTYDNAIALVDKVIVELRAKNFTLKSAKSLVRTIRFDAKTVTHSINGDGYQAFEDTWQLYVSRRFSEVGERERKAWRATKKIVPNFPKHADTQHAKAREAFLMEYNKHD